MSFAVPIKGLENLRLGASHAAEHNNFGLSLKITRAAYEKVEIDLIWDRCNTKALIPATASIVIACNNNKDSCASDRRACGRCPPP